MTRVAIFLIGLAGCAAQTPAVVGIGVGFVVGEPHTLAAVAAAHGEKDIQCPYESIHAYRSVRGTFVAEGCGRWSEYECKRPMGSESTCSRLLR